MPIEVDDWRMAHRPSVQSEEWKSDRARFDFGKMEDWTPLDGEYVGRRVRQLLGSILVDQEKYILEQPHRLPLQRSRRSDRDAPFTGREIQHFRSIVHRFSWVGCETRAEASGIASQLVSKVEHPTVGDAVILNKMVDHLGRPPAPRLSRGVSTFSLSSPPQRPTAVGSRRPAGTSPNKRGKCMPLTLLCLREPGPASRRWRGGRVEWNARSLPLLLGKFSR